MTRPSEHSSWSSPLTERYASVEMARLFSPQFKFETWRRLWVWLAEEEKRLGLPIPDEAISQMRAHVASIDFEAA
ncbi:MAG: adenylosuccinate lyase, partial [Thermoanaerobaculia bacterium]